MRLDTSFTKQAAVSFPIICGAMYPCSNLELVVAVSQAGGMGVVQPLTLAYVYGYDLREGLKKIKTLTAKPFGMNIILERSSNHYEKKMRETVDIALEEGCRFFITSLGNPAWVVQTVKACSGIVYHDVTSRKWAEKALESGVHGIICVNDRAGGHAGTLSAKKMIEELAQLKVPLVCAGGIGNESDFVEAMQIGYDAVQMGTRFIATFECQAQQEYKNAIVEARDTNIILTERVTGIPLSVIRTPFVDKVGTKIGPWTRLLFKNRLTKKLMRIWFGFSAIRNFKGSYLNGGSSREYWQAGKSVEHIYGIEHVSTIIDRFMQALKKSDYSLRL